MPEHKDPLRSAGLTFYGGTCASVSHELKNSLALINENAGLLGDLVAMMRHGKPLDPEKAATITGRIAKHVAKANATIADLNRFGHLVDEPVCRVNLYEAVALAVRLHQRAASQKQVELVFPGEDTGLQVQSRPFELGNALGLCIKAALAAAPGGRVEAAVEPAGEGAAIRLSGIDAAAVEVPADENARALFDSLAATCEVTADPSSLTLGLKPDLEA